MTTSIQPPAGACGPIGIRWGASSAIGFAPDGRLAIAHGPCVSVLDTSGRETARLAFPDTVSSAGFLADGRLVTLVEGGSLDVFDGRGEHLATFAIADACAAFPGTRTASVGIVRETRHADYAMRSLAVLDIDSGVLRDFGGSPPGLDTRADRGFFAPDLSRGAGFDWWGLRLLDASSVRELRIERAGFAAFAGDRLLVGSNDGRVRVLSLEGAEHRSVQICDELRRLEADRDAVLALSDEECLVLDAEAAVVSRTKLPRGVVWAARRSTDGRRLAFVVSRSGDISGGLQRRRVVVQEIEKSRPAFATTAICADVTAVLPVTGALLVGSADGGVRRLDARGEVTIADPKIGEIEALCGARDGIVVIGARGLARIDPTTLALTASVKRRRCDDAVAAVSPDVRLVAVGAERVEIFAGDALERVGDVAELGCEGAFDASVPSRKKARSAPVTGAERVVGGVRAFAYRVEGLEPTPAVAVAFVDHALLTLHESGLVQRFDGPHVTARQIPLARGACVLAGAFSPDGERVALSVKDRAAPLLAWTRTGTLEGDLASGHEAAPLWLAWHGRRIVSAGHDRRVAVCDAETRACVQSAKLDGTPYAMQIDPRVGVVWLAFGASFSGPSGTAALGEIRAYRQEDLAIVARAWMDAKEPLAVVVGGDGVEEMGEGAVDRLAVQHEGSRVSRVPEALWARGVLSYVLEDDERSVQA